MANLKIIFYGDKEIQDIMKKFYLIKRNLLIKHNFVISLYFKYVDNTDFVNFLENGYRYGVDIISVN